jgi:hypothetical protein
MVAIHAIAGRYIRLYKPCQNAVKSPPFFMACHFWRPPFRAVAGATLNAFPGNFYGMGHDDVYRF